MILDGAEYAELELIKKKLLRKIPALNRFQEESDQWTSEFYIQGNFMIALIIDQDREVLSAGVAKCRVGMDEFNSDIGSRIAYSRAIRNMAG